MRVIQTYLGHKNLKTTTIYTHLTRKVEDLAMEAINRVMNPVIDKVMPFPVADDEPW